MSEPTYEELVAENERLRALLPPDLNDAGLVYRAGRCQPTNVYVHVVGDPDGYLLGKMPTPEAATHVIRALNAFGRGGEVSEGRKVLDVPMQANDAEALTIREYLVELAKAAFEIKKPFGNSGWVLEMYEALGKAGLIEAKFDEDGYLDEVDTAAGRKLIDAAIAELAVAR